MNQVSFDSIDDVEFSVTDHGKKVYTLTIIAYGSGGMNTIHLHMLNASNPQAVRALRSFRDDVDAAILSITATR